MLTRLTSRAIESQWGFSSEAAQECDVGGDVSLIGCSASLQLHNVGKRSIGGGMGQWRSAWVWKGGSQHSDPSHSFAVWRCREGLFLGGKGANASVRRAPETPQGWRTVAIWSSHSVVRLKSCASPMHRFVSCGSSVPLFTHIFWWRWSVTWCAFPIDWCGIWPVADSTSPWHAARTWRPRRQPHVLGHSMCRLISTARSVSLHSW